MLILCGTCQARGAVGTSRWTCKLDSLINEHRVSGEMENEIYTVKQSAWRNLLDTGRLLQSPNTAIWRWSRLTSQCHSSDLTLLHMSLTVGLLGSREYDFFISMSLPLHILSGKITTTATSKNNLWVWVHRCSFNKRLSAQVCEETGLLNWLSEICEV